MRRTTLLCVIVIGSLFTAIYALHLGYPVLAGVCTLLILSSLNNLLTLKRQIEKGEYNK